MRISCRQFTYFTRICILCLALKTGLYGADLLNQSINSGGGWVTGTENSSFTVFGELYQSSEAQSNTHRMELNSTTPLAFAENQPIGTIVGEFNATDPDANSTLTYHLVDGNGSESNYLFNINSNGQLRSSSVFDYETNASSYTIRVQVRDEHNASTEGVFTIFIEDLFEDGEDGASMVFWSSQVGGSTSTAGVHRINFDGTKKITLFDFHAYLTVDRNYLYYASGDLGSIYRARHDGTNAEVLVDGYYGLLKVESDYLYWLKNGEGLYRANLDGSGVELYLSQFSGG